MRGRSKKTGLKPTCEPGSPQWSVHSPGARKGQVESELLYFLVQRWEKESKHGPRGRLWSFLHVIVT